VAAAHVPRATPTHGRLGGRGHDDLETADAVYDASPERKALAPDPARLLAEVQTFVLMER